MGKPLASTRKSLVFGLNALTFAALSPAAVSCTPISDCPRCPSHSTGAQQGSADGAADSDHAPDASADHKTEQAGGRMASGTKDADGGRAAAAGSGGADASRALDKGGAGGAGDAVDKRGPGGANGTSAPVVSGAPIKMQPWKVGAASWGAGRIDLFVVGMDRQVHHKVISGSSFWPSKTGWENLGGDFKSPAAVAAWGEGRLDIVAIAADNQLQHKAWTSSSWYPGVTTWSSLGGDFIGPPAIAAWAPDRLDIVAADAAHKAQHKVWNGSAFWPSITDWEDIGADLAGPFALASWGKDRLEIVSVGAADSQMQHKTWASMAWSPSQKGWDALGGKFDLEVGAPAAAAWGEGRLDVVAVGPDKTMQHKIWKQSAWLPSATAWESLGGSFESPGAIVSAAAEQLDVFAVGSDGQLFHKAWRDNMWLPSARDWEPSGGKLASPPSAVVSGVVSGNTRIDVFGVNDQGRVIQRSLSAGKWTSDAWEEL